tara:strand:+ start:23079 stop:24923 length:1845 start_codon:yes stop_codon:yes gene_type:complete
MTQTSGTAPSAEKPFFRYDLQTEAIEDGGQRFVEVTDPNGGKSFRFFEVEYAVACGMDGERSLEALVDWAKSELDLKTTTDELGAIVSKLSELEYLGAGESTASQAEAQDEVAALPEIPAAPVFDEPSSGIEVELGTSGKSPLREDRPAPPAVAADFELGVAGVGEVQRSGRESRDTANMALGAAGNEDVVDAPQDDFVSGPSKEVSTDLSQTFRIDKDEVQAAVRASKVMSAVELPKDIGNELANDQDTLDPAIPEAIPLAADISESIADEASEANSGGKAIVLPEEPAKVAAVAEETKKKPKGPRRNSASMVLWVILLLSAAAFAGYYYMEYVREQPDEKGPVTTPQQAEAQRRAKEPAAPAVPTSTLKVVSAPIEDVVAGRDGLVSWVVAAKTEVAEGDELVRLSGHERADKTIDRHNKSLASYEAQLKIAKDRNRAKVATIESNVARKKLDIELANEKRDAFIIRASIAGVVEPMVKPTAQIKAADVVANITGEASALVEFALPKGTTATVGEQMDVVAKGDAELKSTCTVAEAAGQKVTLSCPTDSGFADGTILELAVPSEAEAAAAGDEAAGDEAAGDEADGDDADADEAAADGDAADADEADGDDAP